MITSLMRQNMSQGMDDDFLCIDKIYKLLSFAMKFENLINLVKLLNFINVQI